MIPTPTFTFTYEEAEVIKLFVATTIDFVSSVVSYENTSWNAP